MSFRDLVRESLRALEANRGRSFLTILGIVIGIAAVIAMTSFIGGVQEGLIGQLGLNASRIVRIGYGAGLSDRDIQRISAALPDYEAVEASVDGYAEVKRDDKTLNVGITGGSPRLFEMTGQAKPVSGRLFTDAENDAASRVVLIDSHGVRLLFGSPDFDAVGKTVKIRGRDYAVVGVFEGQTVAGNDSYLQAIMPAETVRKDFPSGAGDRSFNVVGLAREGADVDDLAERTKQKIAEIKGVTDKDEDEAGIWVNTMKSAIGEMNRFMGSFQLIISSVAGISLLVGGIGIMNMMLTNVTERIREIGVRRALGATRRDITLQFLAESAVICVSGGIIGTVFGYLVSYGLALGASSLGIAGGFGGQEGMAITPAINLQTILLAVGISVAIGLVFGFYPARRAARLDPVECLRYQ
ncbi:MAG: FtsX-like permease family protein [Coriobacteriaceae bacterium]|nr:FtsX-like permease family protein [Coriobacteriaceae bacterium]